MHTRTRVLSALVVGAVLTVGGVTVAQGSGASAPGDAEIPAAEGAEKPAPENGTCRKSFSSGNATYSRFAWCFSNDGSISQLENYGGLEHTGNYEGYCVWSNNAIHGIVRGAPGTLGLNSPTYPAANKVVHVASDGVWRIEQTFAQVVATRSINISMKFTNTSGVRQDGLVVTRFIDADMSGTPGDDQFSAFGASVVAVQPNRARLELLSDPPFTSGLIYPTWVPVLNHQCSDVNSYNWAYNATGDRAMGLKIYLGDGIAPGASRSTVFTYRVTT